MNVITPPALTLDAFLDWERQQELAHEFDGVRVIPMNGGTIAHYLIAANLLRLLWPKLDASRHRVVPAGVKVVWGGRVRYPDLVVAARFDDTAVDIVPEPVVVVEVISPTSYARDTVTKNREYCANPSIQQYVVIEQDAIAATVWLRRGDDWVGTLIDADAILDFPVLGVSVALRDVYEGVSLDTPAPPKA
jgi:Uma2 family endonuclease